LDVDGLNVHGHQRSIRALLINIQKQMVKLRWHDMFFLGMGVPGGVFTVFGYTLGGVGAFYGMVLWGFAAVVALLQNRLWVILAQYFPQRTGGIAMFASEGWKKHALVVAPVAVMGYWMAWSTTNAVLVTIAGQFIVRQWFPHLIFAWHIGPVSVDASHLIAIALLMLFSVFNLRGVQAAAGLAKLSGILLLIPICLCLLLPWTSSKWSLDHVRAGMHLNLPVGQTIRLLLAWLFTINFTAYASEVTTAFTPEYRSRRDLRLASSSISAFSLFVFIAIPFCLAGLADTSSFTVNPAGALLALFGGLLPYSHTGDIIVAILVSNLLIGSNACVADAARALQSSAVDGLVPRQLGKLNSRSMPARAIAVSFVLNALFIAAAASPVALIAAANIGYMVAIVLALSAYLWIKPRSSVRPFPRAWSVLPGTLLALNLIILGVGMTSFALTGYGGWREVTIGLLCLGVSLPLFAYRRYIQDCHRQS
jgi:amino acid transporter